MEKGEFLRRSFSPLMLALLFTLLIVYLPIVSSGNFTLSGLPSDMPAVFVDPPLIEADLGEVFTISVKVFNLSNNCYMADFEWAQGEPLPTPGTSYNYSLGNIMGFDIQFSWDPEILEYVSHTQNIPVEDYPNGILHEPLIPLKDEVDSETGTYHIAESTLGCFPFNMPDGNATVFDMSFVVKGNGSSEFNIIRSVFSIQT